MSFLAARSPAQDLQALHASLKHQLPGIHRVAVALYDARTDALRTFVHSTDGSNPLSHYEALLGEVPSLLYLARSGQQRVVDDLGVFRDSPREHSRRLWEEGFRSSYAAPLHADGLLVGFLFFDSREPQYFTPEVVESLSLYGRLMGLVLAASLTPVRILHSALRVASRLTGYRDPETGAHLDRMSRQARLIARALAGPRGLTDEFVELLFLFAPAHDIGKIAVPDRILLKPGRLDEEEFRIMRSHVTKGAEIVETLIQELGLMIVPRAEILRNVVLYHHEWVDGSGYPEGLRSEAIPIEARIVAVADVFDALTSVRPYKQAWKPDDAIRYLEERSGSQFDADCVAALRASRAETDALRVAFPDQDDARYQSREGYTPEL